MSRPTEKLALLFARLADYFYYLYHFLVSPVSSALTQVSFSRPCRTCARYGVLERQQSDRISTPTSHLSLLNLLASRPPLSRANQQQSCPRDWLPVRAA